MVSRSARRSRTRRARVAEVAAFKSIPRDTLLQFRTAPLTELAGSFAAVQGSRKGGEHGKESQEAADEVKKLTEIRDKLTQSLAARDIELAELRKSSTSKIKDLKAANEKLQAEVHKLRIQEAENAKLMEELTAKSQGRSVQLASDSTARDQQETRPVQSAKEERARCGRELRDAMQHHDLERLKTAVEAAERSGVSSEKVELAKSRITELEGDRRSCIANNPYAQFEILPAPPGLGKDDRTRWPNVMAPEFIPQLNRNNRDCDEAALAEPPEGVGSPVVTANSAQGVGHKRKIVERLLSDPRGKLSKKLRIATLQELTTEDREVLASDAVLEWGADSVTFATADGTHYRAELRESTHRQVNLSTGTVRLVYREPPPEGNEPTWASLTAPGAIWGYEAGYRESEIEDALRFPTPQALRDASMRVPYPAAISRALEVLRQALLRVEFPESERV